MARTRLQARPASDVLGVMVSSAIAGWKEAPPSDNAGNAAFDFLIPSLDERIARDKEGRGMDEERAFVLGFDHAVYICARLTREPFANITDLLEAMAKECADFTANSIEDRREEAAA